LKAVDHMNGEIARVGLTNRVCFGGHIVEEVSSSSMAPIGRLAAFGQVVGHAPPGGPSPAFFAGLDVRVSPAKANDLRDPGFTLGPETRR
jgi:hypothetical protein